MHVYSLNFFVLKSCVQPKNICTMYTYAVKVYIDVHRLNFVVYVVLYPREENELCTSMQACYTLMYNWQKPYLKRFWVWELKRTNHFQIAQILWGQSLSKCSFRVLSSSNSWGFHPHCLVDSWGLRVSSRFIIIVAWFIKFLYGVDSIAQGYQF
jgi:hypothetical protein